MAVASALAPAGCAPRDPHALAARADRSIGAGVYTWLADHDPSKLIVAGLDASTARAVAPSAIVREATSVVAGCRAASAGHALLAVRVRRGSASRDVAQDCGFALFRDDETMVISPR